jgi:phosphoglycolate phosphatase
MSRLIVFDMDGTILNSLPLYTRMAEEYSRQQGLPSPNMQEMLRGYGDPDAHDFGWNVSKEEQRKHLYAVLAMVDNLDYMQRYPMQLFPSATDVINQLHQRGWDMAIVTSKPGRPLRLALEQNQIGHYFKTVRTQDDVEAGRYREKPAPDKLISVMRELSYRPAQTVMVGDTTMDIKMGVSAGAKTVGVAWGAHAMEDLLEAGAHHVLRNDLSTLPEVIDGLV